MLRSERSLTSSTRRQVMPCGSMPERVALVEVVVDHGRQQVVGGRHGVEVAGQVQVEGLEGTDLAVAAAGGATLDPERRAHGGLADGDGGLLADAGQGLPETDGGGRLPFAQRRGGDRRHHDVAGLGPLGQLVDGVQADLGHVRPVVLEQARPADPSGPRSRRWGAGWPGGRSQWQGAAASVHRLRSPGGRGALGLGTWRASCRVPPRPVPPNSAITCPVHMR